MRNLNIILFFVLFMCIKAHGQLIKGTVMNSHGEPYANVEIFHNEKKTLSDSDGVFFINAKRGDILTIKGIKHIINSIPLVLIITEDGSKVNTLKEVKVFAIKRKKVFEKIEFNKKDINKFRGSSNAALFNGIPGLQVNNIRNEAGAIDIGIRGLQGNGRVAMIIDGGLQSLQTNRGYQGSSDRTYIEMDLIKKVKVNKGTSSNPIAIGAVGGVVEMETIDATDIILEGKTTGFYIKGNAFNSNKKPNIPTDEKEQQNYLLNNNDGKFNGGNGTFATAYKNQKFDVLGAFNIHSRGNYFAGKNGIARYDGTVVNPNQEVVNTSYSSQSALAKLGFNISNNQRIVANYRYHGQKAGEVLAAYWAKNPSKEVESMPQWSLGSANINSYGLKYTYNPNKKIDLKVSLFANNGKFNQRNGLAQTQGFSYGEQYANKYKNQRKGITVYNKTVFDSIALTLNYGLTALTEKVTPLATREGILGTARNGKADVYSAFISGDFRWRKFLFQTQIKAHNTRVTDYNTEQAPINYGINVDMMAKVTYNPIKRLKLQAKASIANRSPGLYESTKSTQIFSYNENYPITPEKTNSLEIGVYNRFINIFKSDDYLTFGTNAFYNYTQNYISEGNVKSSIFTFINYDKYTLKGLEFDVNYNSSLVFFNISAILYDEASVCSIDKISKVCKTPDFSWSLLPSRIPPKKTATLEAGFYAIDKKLTVGSRLKYRGEKEIPKDWLLGTGASGIVKNLPADHLVDVFGFYEYNKHITFNLNIDNLTNRYQFDAGSVITMPVPARTIRLGVEVNF